MHTPELDQLRAVRAVCSAVSARVAWCRVCLCSVCTACAATCSFGVLNTGHILAFSNWTDTSTCSKAAHEACSIEKRLVSETPDAVLCGDLMEAIKSLV